MKLGELFIALGFKVEGQSAFEETERGISRATLKASALALAVNGINAALLALANASRQVAIGFKDFSYQTGLSTEELKKWQYVAEVNDVAASELTETIKGIQKATTSVKLGNGNVKPWQLLGLPVGADPFQVLDALRDRVRTLPKDLARTVAADLGISDAVFQMLVRANEEFGELEQHYYLSRQEQDNIIGLNRAWKELVFRITSVRDRVVGQLVPAFTWFLRVAQAALGATTRFFVDMSRKYPQAANVLKGVLVAVIVALAALGVGATGVAAALGLVSVAMGVLSLAAFPVLLVLLKIGLVVGVVVAAISALVLMIEDFWTAAEGGRSLFNWGASLKVLEVMTAAVEKLTAAVTKAGVVLRFFENLSGFRPNPAILSALSGVNPLFGAYNVATRAADMASRGAPVSNQQNNNVQVHIDGSADPRQTGQAVAESIQDMIADAAYQMDQRRGY